MVQALFSKGYKLGHRWSGSLTLTLCDHRGFGLCSVKITVERLVSANKENAMMHCILVAKDGINKIQSWAENVVYYDASLYVMLDIMI